MCELPPKRTSWPLLGIVGHRRSEPSLRATRREQGPGAAVPGPGVARNAATGRTAPEEDQSSGTRVVGHGGVGPGRGAGGRRGLGPGAAVPGPGVVDGAAGRLAPEEDQLAGRRIVGHRRASTGRGAGGRRGLGPGRAVPGPGVVERLPPLPGRRRGPVGRFPGRRPSRPVAGRGLVGGENLVQVVPFQVQVSLRPPPSLVLNPRRGPVGLFPGRRPSRRSCGPRGWWPGLSLVQSNAAGR